MRIRIEIKNKILGNSILWEGDYKDIDQVKEVLPNNMAFGVFCDGKTRKDGMWIVSEIKD